MTVAVSEGAEVPEPNSINLNRKSAPVDTDGIIENIRMLLEKHENPSESLQAYLDEVEASIEQENKRKLSEVNRDELKTLIERHPFFKNPNNYYIRLITIMKYLKKKGVDISLPDMDILVDEVILSIDGVKKRGYGQYSRMK